jgi:hypothetical protein
VLGKDRSTLNRAKGIEDESAPHRCGCSRSGPAGDGAAPCAAAGHQQPGAAGGQP